MSKPNSSHISNLITKSADVCDEKAVPISAIGLQLLKIAKSQVVEPVIDSKNAIISQDYDARMRELKKAEQEKDLCWMEYSSFNILSTTFKELFVQTLDPMNWNGLFFRYSHLLSIEKEIWSHLDPDYCVFELLEMNGNRKLVVLNSARSSTYDYSGVFELRKSQKHFKDYCLRSIGNTAHGVTIKVHTNEEEMINEFRKNAAKAKKVVKKT